MRVAWFCHATTMKYNPDIHHRRSIRMKHYDYSRNGAYFVTLCTIDRACYFDLFPKLRDIVDGEWHNIPERFPNVELDEYVIMPNHFHGIIMIHDDRRDTPRGYPELESEDIRQVLAFAALTMDDSITMLDEAA